MVTEQITLEIEGSGDIDKFKSDLLALANGDPDWQVSLLPDE